MSVAPELKTAPQGASDMAHIVLTFDDNKLASALYGQFDENLARIEQKLGLDIRSKGNQLSIRGEPTAAEQARRALDYLYGLVQKGHDVSPSEVDGAIRISIAADDQLTLPTLEKKGKMAAAQIATRKRTIYARSVNQDAYMRALERSELVFGIGPAGTGKTYLAVAHAAMLLERGAARVFAVDVGHGQLAPRLAADRRVVSLEGLNARDLSAATIGAPVGAITADLSFISLRLALPPALDLAAPGAFAVVLVKPQFEVGRDGIGKGGIVRDTDAAERAATAIADWVSSLPGWSVDRLVPSPLAGGDGNREFLLGARHE